MKFTSLLKPQSTTTGSALTNPLTTTNLVGSLTHVYEYIPAIVFGLHDLSFLDETFLLNFSQDQNNNTNNDNNNNNETVNNGNTNRQTESFWSRLRTAIHNKSSHDMDFNFLSSSYEVLCLCKQPATLKQLCVIELNKLDDCYMSDSEEWTERERYNNLDLFRQLNAQPNSIRQLLWPCFLLPGKFIWLFWLCFFHPAAAME